MQAGVAVQGPDRPGFSLSRYRAGLRSRRGRGHLRADGAKVVSGQRRLSAGNRRAGFRSLPQEGFHCGRIHALRGEAAGRVGGAADLRDTGCGADEGLYPNLRWPGPVRAGGGPRRGGGGGCAEGRGADRGRQQPQFEGFHRGRRQQPPPAGADSPGCAVRVRERRQGRGRRAGRPGHGRSTTCWGRRCWRSAWARPGS